jgi:hypothetical protein
LLLAFQKQPAVSTIALELALRSHPCGELLDFTFEALGLAAGAAGVAAGAAQAERTFSLLMTACKVAERLALSTGSSSDAQLASKCYSRMAAITRVGKLLAGQCTMAAAADAARDGSVAERGSPVRCSSGRSKLGPVIEDGSGKTADALVGSIDSKGSKARDLWAVLAARCLHVMCTKLEVAAAAGASAGMPQSTAAMAGAAMPVAADGWESLQLRSTQQVLSSLAAAAAWLGQLLKGLEQQQQPAVTASSTALQADPPRSFTPTPAAKPAAATVTVAAGAATVVIEHAGAGRL